MKPFYVYKITCVLNEKVYIGKGTVRTKTYGPEKDHYYGSGIHIKRAVSKHGKENFTKVILSWHDTSDEAFLEEIKQIELFKATDPDMGYNISTGGSGWNSVTGRMAHARIKEKGLEFENYVKQRRAEGLRRPEIREKNRTNTRDMWKNFSEVKREEIIKKLKDYWKNGGSDKRKEYLKGVLSDPVKSEAYRNKLSEGVRKANQTEEYKRKQLEALEKRKESGEWQRTMELNLELQKHPLSIERNKLYNGPKGSLKKLLNKGMITVEEYSEKVSLLDEWKKDWDIRWKKSKEENK